MSARELISLGLLLANWLGAADPDWPEARNSKQPQTVKAQTVQALGGVPLVFEPNLGQTDSRVRFLTRTGGMTSFLTDHENVIALSRRKSSADAHDPHVTPDTELSVVRIELDGARAPRSFEGIERAGSISNYFIGSEPSKWVTNVPNYRRVRASDVYPGVDLVYYGDGRKLEYDLVVRAGGNPESIRLRYKGAVRLSSDKQGNLLIGTHLGTIIQRKPRVYQEIDGARREIQASYSIRAGKVGFAVAKFDRKRDLVIDPVLEYATYLGGTGGETSYGIAVGSGGDAYVTGYTNSADFPTTSGAYATAARPPKVFVTRLNASGTSLVYSTYLGGNKSDQGYGIAVDAAGEAFITGTTSSNDFPTTPGSYQPSHGGGSSYSFVTKLNTAGSALAYSTYLGANSSLD